MAPTRSSHFGPPPSYASRPKCEVQLSLQAYVRRRPPPQSLRVDDAKCNFRCSGAFAALLRTHPMPPRTRACRARLAPPFSSCYSHVNEGSRSGRVPADVPTRRARCRLRWSDEHQGARRRNGWRGRRWSERRKASGKCRRARRRRHELERGQFDRRSQRERYEITRKWWQRSGNWR